MMILISAAITFLVSVLLTCIVKFVAEKKSILDIPNDRSSHVLPTPRGGGIAIAITWFSLLTCLFILHQIETDLYYALMVGLLISLLGFLDDIYNIKFQYRLAVQSISVIAALFFMGGLIKIDFGFFVFENKYILSLIAFFGIVWFINLYNFIDGIDGYAATEAVFVSVALWIFTQSFIVLLFSIAVLGFLPFNWQKARIFMGDAGSTLLGFTLAVFAIYYQNVFEFSIFYWLILTSVFWFDATYTLYRRFRNGEKITAPHKKHIYQRIVQFGFSHQKTVLFSIAINFILFGLVFFSKGMENFILAFFSIDIVFLFFIKSLVERKKPF